MIANAEEVAFLDGSAREKDILNRNLFNVTSFSDFYFLLQFRQGCVDQLTLKYLASMIGWPIIAVPFLRVQNMTVSEVNSLTLSLSVSLSLSHSLSFTAFTT